MLETNLYEVLGGFSSRMINTEVLGKAFEPEEPFENPDGTPIQFDMDYFRWSSWSWCPARSLRGKRRRREKIILNLRAAWLLWAALFIFPGDRNPGMGYNECIILLNGHRIA